LHQKNISSQIQYWNKVAPEKSFSHPLRADWLGHHLNTDARILDVGCGYGRTLKELAHARFSRCVGLDFSAAMLARCRSEAPAASLIRNDGESLPLQSESVDAVLLFAVLTCIPDSGKQKALIDEARRVLRPQGLLYISDLLINKDERNQKRYAEHANKFGCFGVFELPEGVVVRHHSEDWMAEITRPFEQLKYEPFTVTTMNGNASAAFQYLGRKST
jgi:ubiquinone/menaquinone biosynthesis C-methylase UbiE